MLLLLASCGEKHVGFMPGQRHRADSVVNAVHGADSLALLQKRLEHEGDQLGSIVALREWGRALRNENHFDEALRVHGKGLQIAEAVGDTIEWVQALNNIGTDYRRTGVLDMAQEYHYRALRLSEECSDTSSAAKKNRVMSLNGLGNIYMTLGNYVRADSVLRLALAGERQLGSAVGQAINYANLGSIFEHQSKSDSAWVYYRRSMELNQEAGDTIGMALCHTYFGQLYERARLYDEALQEYQAGYEQMKASKDYWHALTPLIAMAEISDVTGDNAQAADYIGKAMAMAERIHSVEHLAQIYTVCYRRYKRLGDYREALRCREEAAVLRDSVVNMEKVNRIQSVSLNVERSLQARQMSKAREKLEHERIIRHRSFFIFGIVTLLLVSCLIMLYYVYLVRHRQHLVLKKASSMRESFFTNITHEFRTPLTVILGLSRDMAADSDLPTEARERARVIGKQGDSLLELINQLLDISKVKSAVGDPGYCSGNIMAHLGMIVESYRNYADSRNIELLFTPEGEVEMDFVPDYVNKVMNNLLSNAFKYTPAYGKIVVAAWREGGRLLVNVTDTGVGISREDMPRIFEPFYQVDGESRHLGTGVGLALVKQIVDAVNGTITVESTVGRGTTFHVSVPVSHHSRKRMDAYMEKNVNTPLLPEIETAVVDAGNGGSDCRVLIIEDNRDVAAYIGSQLSDRYALFYAADGREGLEKALEIVPDLIITDLMMPGMDGLELCRQVRSNEIVNHIPLIVVTAKVTEDDRIKGIKAGADAYIAKPFNSGELRMWVEKLLEQRRLLRERYARIAVTDKKDDLMDAEVESDAGRRFMEKVTGGIYLLINRGDDVNVSLLASKMCMSESQFYRKIMALTGYAPTAYIQRVKIRKACQLLDKRPGMNFSEVADLSGFADYSSFVRAFRNVLGTTPTGYTRKIK